MSFLAGIKSLFSSGSFASDILNTVKEYFPPDMSEAEKQSMKIAIENQIIKKELLLHKQIVETEKTLTDRISQLEGTASELKTIPVVGPLMIFLRGCQRPAFGFGCLYMDWKVFSGAWIVADGGTLASAFLVMNILVLGFLFGERAIKNVAPFLERVVAAKAATK